MLQIVYCLTGNDKFPPILDRQMDEFVYKLRDEVEDLIWEGRLRGYPSADLLFQSYEKLSDAERAKLFLSSEGYEAIRMAVGSRTPGALEVLAAAIEHTNALAAAAPLPTGDEAGSEEAPPERVLIGETIVVDLGSAWVRRHEPTSPVFFSPYEQPTAEETRKIVDKLSAALAEIDASAPTFGRMIRNYTRTILVRKIGDLLPASEQVDTELGAIRLRNVHSDMYTHDQLVDDLIHESTHNFLGTFEYLQFPFIPFGELAGRDVRPVSPWSMRPIQVLPFLHAVFVYFAMLHYASRRLAADGLPAEEVKRLQQRRNRYSSGFLMPGRLSAYVASLAKVDPRVLGAIQNMESVVASMIDAEQRVADIEQPPFAMVA
jgi:hypothetical protein